MDTAAHSSAPPSGDAKSIPQTDAERVSREMEEMKISLASLCQQVAAISKQRSTPGLGEQTKPSTATTTHTSEQGQCFVRYRE